MPSRRTSVGGGALRISTQGKRTSPAQFQAFLLSLALLLIRVSTAFECLQGMRSKPRAKAARLSSTPHVRTRSMAKQARLGWSPGAREKRQGRRLRPKPVSQHRRLSQRQGLDARQALLPPARHFTRSPVAAAAVGEGVLGEA